MLRADYLTVNEKREAIGYGKRPDGDVLLSSRGATIDLGGAEALTKRVDASLLAALSPALARKFDPDQPRVPAGSADGGQWTDGGGGRGGTSTTAVAATSIGIGRPVRQQWLESGEAVLERSEPV